MLIRIFQSLVLFQKIQIERNDQPLFPIATLREAITNSICHRDYSYTGGSSSGAIYDNRLEIWSYGLLPPGLSIEALGELNQSVPRNRRIANILYYHKLFESWGRGIKLIIDGCIEAGHPKPFYTQNSGGILLTMPSTQLSNTEIKKPLTSGEEVLTEYQKEILSLLEKNSFSTAELKKKLSFNLSERWLREELNRLNKLGFVDATGKTTARKWFIIKK